MLKKHMILLLILINGVLCNAAVDIGVSASAGMQAKSSQELEKMVGERDLALSKEIARIVLTRLEQAK